MNIGMLWFDNDPKAELSSKIERAASYYRNKYGATPTVCFVHPSMLTAHGNPDTNTGLSNLPVYRSAGVEVHPTRSVLPNHLWIGVGSKE
jgi:hypothetical protein